MKKLSELTWGEIESDIKEFYNRWKRGDRPHSNMSAEAAIPLMFEEKYGWGENVEYREWIPIDSMTESIKNTEPEPLPNTANLNNDLNLIATIFHYWFKDK